MLLGEFFPPLFPGILLSGPIISVQNIKKFGRIVSVQKIKKFGSIVSVQKIKKSYVKQIINIQWDINQIYNFLLVLRGQRRKKGESIRNVLCYFSYFSYLTLNLCLFLGKYDNNLNFNGSNTIIVLNFKILNTTFGMAVEHIMLL
eukprot:TRINITY_DN45147_c0_g2_i4.p3 TRINITY_DN45147_c0_g2~~TRINITY_DN45147_c0_g2_i4.p3  ORF type:complete len:145 (+),score=5.63 TRINITY_DN45147_c0_g2_i4:179-613(+)